MLPDIVGYIGSAHGNYFPSISQTHGAFKAVSSDAHHAELGMRVNAREDGSVYPDNIASDQNFGGNVVEFRASNSYTSPTNPNTSHVNDKASSIYKDTTVVRPTCFCVNFFKRIG